MPRKIDPKNKIKTGTGLAGNDSIEANAFPDTDPNMAVGVGLEAHIKDPVDAHEASAISYENEPVYFGDNVDDVLDELGGLVPPRPPTVGNWKTYLGFVGITDWGVLKLNDDTLDSSLFVHANIGSSIYPYYHNPPKRWTDIPPSEPSGADLSSDMVFNVSDGAYTGGGDGVSFAGGYTRGTDIKETHNIYKDGNDHVVVSGSLFPADRGTLALFYVPPQGTLADVVCIAALNCGQGIEDGCDGETGGIWNYGLNDDPYQFPSAASGQYDLQELHTGYVRNSVTTITLIEPSADPSIANVNFAVPPTYIVSIGDKIYIEGSDSTPSVDGEHEVVGFGLGLYQIVATITVNGTTGTVGQPLEPSDFNPSLADEASGQVREEYTILGGTSSSVLPTKGVDSRDDNNFFRYRLPYLENYTELLWTPPSQTNRYFKKPPVSQNPSSDLDLAGNYMAFNKDYWTFQVARYRHRFAIPSGAGSEKGSFFIIHFKKEEYFENLLLDTLAPTEDQVYSATLTDWADFESVDNIYTVEGTTKPSSSYNILKSRLFSDPEGEGVVVNTPPYTLERTIDTVLYVSGIRYFKTTAGFGLNTVNFTMNNLFLNSWRMGDKQDVTKQGEGFQMPNPCHYFTGSFGRNLSGVTLAHGDSKGNRIEIPYTLLGAYDLTNAPLPADVASYTSPSIFNVVATSEPVFSSQATPMVIARQPIRHKDTNYTVGASVLENAGKNIMVHSTDDSLYQDSTTPIHSAERDVMENFLDEGYRWIWDLDASGTPPAITADEITRILGAGLPTTGVIDIPVQIGASAVYDAASFMVQGRHLNVILGTPEAQFAGLPFRNPPMQEGVAQPNAPRGILMYPQKNYFGNYRPSAVDGDLTIAQPDYSGATGDKVFIRAFDTAFSRSVTPLPEAIGSSFFKLRIHGLQLNDFAWSGGASAGGLGIAILVKLAGLTTWMDIGRVDGSGASKQDAFSDGAGCQINDPTETKNGVDSLTGIVYADVLIHTGAVATLYDNGLGEAPILVKVVIKDSVEGKALNFEQGGANDYIGNARGLVGLELLRPE